MVAPFHLQAVTIKLPGAADAGVAGPMLQCQAVQVGYPGAAPLSQPFDLDVTMSSRVGILGMNGSGKPAACPVRSAHHPARRTLAMQLRGLVVRRLHLRVVPAPAATAFAA